MLVISCHADTGFRTHTLKRLRGGILKGHLDNFVGVHAVMKAYFSGRMRPRGVRIELTHGEEKNFRGAKEVRRTLRGHDVVIVVDVTGTPTNKAFVIEKCGHLGLQAFFRKALRKMAFDLYEKCPDPISDEDEVDVYLSKTKFCAFLGIPCFGGDYNAGPVQCREASIEAATEALIRVSKAFPRFCRQQGIQST